MAKIVHIVKWAKINSFNSYFISNTGFVRLNKRILPFAYGGNKRPFVSLREADPKNKKYERKYIHELVWTHFSGKEKVKGFEIHHKDGDYLNNHIDNLEYLSKEQHYEKHKQMKNILNK